MKLRNLIDIEDLSLEEWNELYGLASQIIAHPKDFVDALHGDVMASLFFEPSTRTNFSFQTAMLRLGGSVFGFADPKSSSTSKGETLKDTVKMVSRLCGCDRDAFSQGGSQPRRQAFIPMCP